MKTESIAAEAAPLAVVVQDDDEPRVDSRQLAVALGVAHHSAMKLIATHAARFAAVGVVRFEIHKPRGRAGGRPERYAMLNEDQAYLLLTFAKNTPQASDLKVHLIVAFKAARTQNEAAVLITLSEWEHAMKVERDAAVSQAMGSMAGKVLAQRRVEKPRHEQALDDLREHLQLVFWPKLER